MARHIFDQQLYQTMFKSRSVLLLCFQFSDLEAGSYCLLWLIQGASSRQGYLFTASGN